MPGVGSHRQHGSTDGSEHGACQQGCPQRFLRNGQLSSRVSAKSQAPTNPAVGFQPPSRIARTSSGEARYAELNSQTNARRATTNPTNSVSHTTDSTSMPASRPLRLQTYMAEATGANNSSSEYSKTNEPTTLALFKYPGS